VPTEFDTRTTPILFFITDYLSKYLSFFTSFNVGAHTYHDALAVMPSDDDAFYIHLSHTTYTRVESSQVRENDGNITLPFRGHSIKIYHDFDGMRGI